jgi:CubicO group peptidase (beta-lactamase class C family)
MAVVQRIAFAALFAASLILPLNCAGQDTAERDRERKVDQLFADYEKSPSPGCAVGIIRNGEFVYRRGYGQASLELGVPLTPQSVFYMGSVSKQFTAASVVLAAEQGFLSLDDDVRKWVPELPSYGKPITIREMLHHTSGLRDIFSLLFLSGRNAEDLHPTPELVDLVAHQKGLNFPTNDEFLYSNTNYFLMSVIIKRTTGKPLSVFAEENIFKPLGMSHTRFYDDHTLVVPGRVAAYEPASDGFRLDWSTNFDKVGDGGLMSSVDDLLLWDRSFYDNKLGKGTLLKELQTQGVLNGGKTIEYALGLFISSYRGLPIVSHGGALFGYRTILMRFPRQKFSVIGLCNVGTANTSHFAEQIADIYLDGQFPLDAKDGSGAKKAAASGQPADAQALSGIYRDADSHSVYKLSAADGDLVLFGQHLKSTGLNQFAFPGGAELQFAAQPNSGMRMTISPKDSASEIFERFVPVTPSAGDLAQYAGTYASDELETKYKFAVKDGKLTLSVNWQDPATLEPSVPNEFTGRGGVTYVFVRDAQNRVSALDVFAGRVRNIRFTRAD